jgi:putative acetyltransferase
VTDRPAVDVRLAQVEDAQPIAELLHSAFAQYEALYTPAAFGATTPTVDQLRHRWAEGPVWVAIRNGQLLGTVAAVRRDQDLYLRSMAVLPYAHGQGIAALLLRQVERFAQAQGARRLVLSTTPFLRNAIRLYERSGFRWTGSGPDSLRGTPIFSMSKEVRRWA